MAKLGTIALTGASSTLWTFDVYPRETTFRAVGAVYVQSVRTPKGGRRRKPTTAPLSMASLRHSAVYWKLRRQ